MGSVTVLHGVFSYVNPDTDGVACMLGYKELLAKSPHSDHHSATVRPGIFGDLNPETCAVLAFLGLERPDDGHTFLSEVDSICLVDTHHLAQLPDGVHGNKVVEVIDHHGGGDSFPNARVLNEPVGAAATLLVERFARLDAVPNTAVLLGAAIISNTLEFRAPSSTKRDRDALTWLEQGHAIPNQLIGNMRSARESFLVGKTKEVLGQDVKVFDRSDGSRVLMSQVEAHNAALLGRRPDVVKALAALADESGTSLALANLADLSLGLSLLICTNKSLQNEVREALGIMFDVDGQGWASELMLRKTHLVPALVERRDVLEAGA
jgi:inorganic pyrophosphatase/exopolyphosphatase